MHICTDSTMSIYSVYFTTTGLEAEYPLITILPTPPGVRHMDTSPQLRHILQKMVDTDPTHLPTPSACVAGKPPSHSNTTYSSITLPPQGVPF